MRRVYDHSTDDETRRCLRLYLIGALYCQCPCVRECDGRTLLEVRAGGRTFIYEYPFSARVGSSQNIQVEICQCSTLIGVYKVATTTAPQVCIVGPRAVYVLQHHSARLG